MKETVKTNVKRPEAKRENSPLSHEKKMDFSGFISSPVNQLFFLQRTMGNRAVERLLKSGVIQAKLNISQPGDIYEQEADRVAEQVMRMPDRSKAQRKRVSKDDKYPSIQRMCTECEEELHGQTQNSELGSSSQEELYRQPMEEEEEIIQTKEVDGETSEISKDVESKINSVRGGGQPLPESVRAFFEPRFGQDFSHVRIHTDSNAGESAKAVNALAYTVGQDVVFSSGQYSPGTESGKKLITHELTHVVQEKNNRPRSLIHRKNGPGTKGSVAGDVPGGKHEPDEYQHSSTFRNKGKISIVSSTRIIKVSEVLHTRQTPKGREKLPYEFVLEHERRVEVETVSGDKAVLIIKANEYLPFDKLNANPKMSAKLAISLSGDFCNLQWSLDGEYGTGKFKEELFRRYGMAGTQAMVGGKLIELFFAASFHEGEILKPKNPRDPCSLKEITEATGPAFLRFNLSDQKQYEHIVDYLSGLLGERLKSEVDIRKKLEEEKKGGGEKKEDLPIPQLAKSIEQEAELAPEDLKGITLPGWLKGILIALGIALAVVAVVAAVAAIIAGIAELAGAAAFAAAFWAAFKIIGTALLVVGFVRSLINRFGESKLSGIGDFFKKLGISILDILSIGELIESFTDRSLITGKPLNLSEEDRWKRRTFGVLAIIGAVFGIRSWLKKGPARGAPGAGATTAEALAQQHLERIFSELGGPKKGYKIQICDDSTVIETPTTRSNIGINTRSQGGALTDTVEKTVWIHESLLRQNGIFRKWGSQLNIKQVIAHELGHAETGSFSCAVASRTGANIPGLTAVERTGLLDDAVHIARQEGVRLDDLNLPKGYEPPKP